MLLPGLEGFMCWKGLSRVLICSTFLTLCQGVNGQSKNISRKNIAFIQYPDFDEAHSTWGSIGYNPVYNTVYIGVTNHKDKVGLYEYKVANGEMKLKGFINNLGHLRKYQWQGKIHSKIVMGPKGEMYFSTDGGESREEYLMNHPQGYSGGFFMKWDPASNRLTNLGNALQYESIKDVEVDKQTGLIYGVTYPQAHFIVYDPAKNNLRDFGRLASSHVPRVIFTDWWGNCYYVDWRLRLVKYEKDSDSLVFAENSLPTFPNTTGNKIITGLTAYAKDEKNNTIYIITYGAKVLAFHPQRKGIGKVEDLGGVAETGEREPYGPYVPNLNLGNNGMLYYIVGGHGNYIKENKTVLMEFNPKTKKSRIVFEYPIDEIGEATGSDIKDKEGNLYFAGRKEVSGHDSSKPFMIKFNPEKEVNK